MAQDEELNEESAAQEEADELERLLEEGGEEAAEGEAAEKPAEDEGGEGTPAEETAPAGKKKWILIGGGVFLLLAVAGGVFFFFLQDKAPPEEALEKEEPPAVVTVKKDFDKVHIYPLKTFFLPLKSNGRELGRFITVTPNLILSNPDVDEEITKVLPSLREDIYNILARKKPSDYFQRKGQIEERIKKEILIAANASLTTGIGTVQDIAYTQFVVK